MAQFNLLAAKLREASQEYYTTGQQTMSDEVFDSAQKLLKEVDPEAAEVSSVGWGYDVGQDSTPGEKFQHTYGLVGSLDKAYSWDEINKVLKGKNVDISLKLDGLSMVLYYKQGVLVRAVTRGDGVTGIDVTDKILHVVKEHQIHLKDKTFTGAVRGEILMLNADWDKFKTLHPEAKNSRNATAGLLNANEVRDDLKYLTIVVYKVVGSQSKPPMSMPTMNVWLQDNFLFTAPHAGGVLTSCDNFKELSEILNGNSLPTDGLVMKLFDIGWNSSTGEVTYTEQAYKFPAEVAVTEVDHVEWNLTKNRLLVPRVSLKTVHISGTDVSWATGYNAEYILNNRIGPGAVVSVEKHGEIIPNINEVLVPSEFYQVPHRCPCCYTELDWQGVHLVCPNENCSNAKLQDLLVWSDVLAPIDGFGDTLRTKYFKQLLRPDVSIEKLMTDRPLIQDPSGVQDTMCNTMLQKLYSDNPVGPVSAIQCLNIPRIADMNAAKLNQYFVTLRGKGMTWPQVIDHILDRRNFYEVADAIGKANAESVQNNPVKLERLNFISHRLVDIGMTLIQYTPVAVTGKLSVRRSDFDAELRNYGFVISEIKSGVAYLITDDPNSGSEKNRKADKLGIPKITEAQFRAQYMEETKE